MCYKGCGGVVGMLQRVWRGCRCVTKSVEGL